jgi:hypothetical protein
MFRPHQRLRIERQRHLIARHERDGYPDLVADAVRMLDEMERALARMEAHYAKAQEHLVQVAVDEPSLANVERNGPTSRGPLSGPLVWPPDRTLGFATFRTHAVSALAPQRFTA